MGSLELVFSCVFGDGNPNGDVEERRLALVAEMIRNNSGVVTAELLAPFCDDIPLPNDDNMMITSRGNWVRKGRTSMKALFCPL